MITIGITTYNRKNILSKMAESLYLSNLDLPYNIRIYDDCSSEYSLDYLRKIFPDVKNIVRNEINLKANKNIYTMYKDFLNSDDEYLFNADSDLIFSKNWLEKGLNFLHNTDGILSLFNAQNLKPVENINNDLCIKEKIGSAGSLLTRKCVSTIINHIKLSDLDDASAFDFKWCELLRKNGRKIYCVRNSLVQHIGIEGQNSGSHHFDFGIGFHIDNLRNGQFMQEAMEVYCSTNRQRSSYFLFPFEKIMPKSKIIIYGFGKVGQDFIKQIEQTNYCEIVGIIDKNYLNFNECEYKVSNPSEIRKLEADYLLIAVNSDSLANEIINEIKKENNQLLNKVIYARNRKMNL